MKRFNFGLIAVLIIAIGGILLMESCKKEGLNDDTNINSPSALIANLSNQPTTENGILKFASQEALDQYMDFLDESITCSQENCELNSDSILLSIERSLNHNSYREYYYLLTEGEFSSLDDFPNAKYIDPSLQSLLNEHFEVIVGEKYHNIYFPEVEILIEEYNYEAIQYLRGNIDRFDEDNIYEIAEELDANGIIEFEKVQIQPAVLAVVGDIDEGQNGYSFTSLNIDHKSSCYDEGVTIWKLALNSFTNPVNWPFPTLDFEITMDWGDGSAPQTTATTNSFWGYAKRLNLRHTYPKATSPTTYTLNYSVSHNNTIVITGSETITLTRAVCDYNGNKYKNVWSYPQSDRAMKMEAQIVNNWSTHRVSATTTSLKKKNNGNWRKKKASKNVVQLWSKIYNTDGCDYEKDVARAEWGNNKKVSSVSEGIGHKFGYTDFHTNHRIKIDDNTYSYDINLEPCP